MTELTPFVYWAQTESDITLRVDIQLDSNSTDGESKKRRPPPEVCIESDEIEVSAVGVGAQSGNYHFVLEFYLPVDTEKSSYQVRDNGIQITLVKKERDWWPRLIYQQHKLPWLRIDFDRWRDVDDETGGEEDGRSGGDDAAGKKDDPFAGMSTEDMIRNKYPDIYRDLEKDELGYVSESTKKVYLAAYNMFMTTGFLYVAAVLFIRLAKDDFEVVLEGNEAHENVGKVVMMLHLMTILEVLHPLFGYTSGSVAANAGNVARKLAVLFVLIDSEPRMHKKPVVFYLYAIWSVMEVVRYPYQLLRVYHLEFGLLTWLKYTIWIPLVPAGFVCEGVIALRDIPYFEETGKFSLVLPNPYNWSFYVPNLIRVYLLFFFFPVMYTVMNRLYQLRCKKLKVRQHPKNRASKED